MATLARLVAPALILAVVLQSTSALAQNTAGRSRPPAAAPRAAHYLAVKVWESGSFAPNVSVRVPTALVSTTLALASWSGILDRGLDAARAHASEDCPGMRIRITGRQIVSLWSDIVSGGPTDLVRVDDGPDRVLVRLE